MYLWDTILSSPCPSLHLSVTLPKGILAAVPYMSLPQKLQGPSGALRDEEGEANPACSHTHVRPNHYLLTALFSGGGGMWCYTDMYSLCCQELCGALTPLII